MDDKPCRKHLLFIDNNYRIHSSQELKYIKVKSQQVWLRRDVARSARARHHSYPDVTRLKSVSELLRGHFMHWFRQLKDF